MESIESVQDTELLEKFERAEIPLSCWTHRTHLRIAYSYLRDFPLETAMTRLQMGIRAFNEANGLEDALLMGYHETMTRAWATLVDFTMRQCGAESSSEEFLDSQPQLCAKSLLRLYYSKERICTLEAKKEFAEPDLAPFPVSRNSA